MAVHTVYIWAIVQFATYLNNQQPHSMLFTKLYTRRLYQTCTVILSLMLYTILTALLQIQRQTSHIFKFNASGQYIITVLQLERIQRGSIHHF